MLTAAGANAGVLKGLPCLFGAATGMGLMLFLVPLGLGSVVLQHPLALKVLNWGGAAFLLWLSWKIATASRVESMAGGEPLGYLHAVMFQCVNPKSWLVSASAAGTFLSAGAGSPIAQSAILGGLFVLAALPSCFIWLAFGATVQRVLHSRRRVRVFNIAMGVALALSIGLIIS